MHYKLQQCIHTNVGIPWQQWNHLDPRWYNHGSRHFYHQHQSHQCWMLSDLWYHDGPDQFDEHWFHNCVFLGKVLKIKSIYSSLDEKKPNHIFICFNTENLEVMFKTFLIHQHFQPYRSSMENSEKTDFQSKYFQNIQFSSILACR